MLECNSYLKRSPPDGDTMRLLVGRNIGRYNETIRAPKCLPRVSTQNSKITTSTSYKLRSLNKKIPNQKKKKRKKLRPRGRLVLSLQSQK